MNDALGFTGPVILNLIVRFLENGMILLEH